MRRKGLKRVNLHGQESQPNAAEVERWQTEIVPEIEAEFPPDCRYNTDEFPFFWQKLPKRSIVLKSKFFYGVPRSSLFSGKES